MVQSYDRLFFEEGHNAVMHVTSAAQLLSRRCDRARFGERSLRLGEWTMCRIEDEGKKGC